MAQTVLFGRYRLLERAGTGGTADVWCARDERTGDDVALKRLHPIVFRSKSGRSRLEREFRALRSLDEPHIVRVRDLVLTDDDGALILDYVAGTSLETRLADGQPLSVAESIAIADQVGAALTAAHAAGIIHRDVKPGNVLLSPDGMARLTDFGIAHGSTDETAVTATGTVVGTLRYLAPEQLRGELATASGDLYGLAAMTYEMLAGRPAYAATTPWHWSTSRPLVWRGWRVFLQPSTGWSVAAWRPIPPRDRRRSASSPAICARRPAGR